MIKKQVKTSFAISKISNIILLLFYFIVFVEKKLRTFIQTCESPLIRHFRKINSLRTSSNHINYLFAKFNRCVQRLLTFRNV